MPGDGEGVYAVGVPPGLRRVDVPQLVEGVEKPGGGGARGGDHVYESAVVVVRARGDGAFQGFEGRGVVIEFFGDEPDVEAVLHHEVPLEQGVVQHLAGLLLDADLFGVGGGGEGVAVELLLGKVVGEGGLLGLRLGGGGIASGWGRAVRSRVGGFLVLFGASGECGEEHQGGQEDAEEFLHFRVLLSLYRFRLGAFMGNRNDTILALKS